MPQGFVIGKNVEVEKTGGMYTVSGPDAKALHEILDSYGFHPTAFEDGAFQINEAHFSATAKRDGAPLIRAEFESVLSPTVRERILKRLTLPHSRDRSNIPARS